MLISVGFGRAPVLFWRVLDAQTRDRFNSHMLLYWVTDILSLSVSFTLPISHLLSAEIRRMKKKKTR